MIRLFIYSYFFYSLLFLLRAEKEIKEKVIKRKKVLIDFFFVLVYPGPGDGKYDYYLVNFRIAIIYIDY